MGDVTQANIQAFIHRWQASGAAERANYQLFLTELCAIIDAEHPRPKTPHEHENAYVFEKAVPSGHGTTNFIDLYKRGCFVLEAKQGSDKLKETSEVSETSEVYRKRRKKGTAVRGTAGWDTAMEKARNTVTAVAAERQPWPKALKDRATAVRSILAAMDGPADLRMVAAAFKGKRTQKRLGKIEEILDMLVMLGQAVEGGNGRYAVG